MTRAISKSFGKIHNGNAKIPHGSWNKDKRHHVDIIRQRIRNLAGQLNAGFDVWVDGPDQQGIIGDPQSNVQVFSSKIQSLMHNLAGQHHAQTFVFLKEMPLDRNPAFWELAEYEVMNPKDWYLGIRPDRAMKTKKGETKEYYEVCVAIRFRDEKNPEMAVDVQEMVDIRAFSW